MKESRWISPSAAMAIHQRVLLHFGGLEGLRDKTPLESALARPQHLRLYQPAATLHELAAACSWAIAKNHPFVDGNKRTAFLVGAVFLMDNGCIDRAEDADIVITFQQLAAGKMSQKELGHWFEHNFPLP